MKRKRALRAPGPHLTRREHKVTVAALKKLQGMGFESEWMQNAIHTEGQDYAESLARAIDSALRKLRNE